MIRLQKLKKQPQTYFGRLCWPWGFCERHNRFTSRIRHIDTHCTIRSFDARCRFALHENQNHAYKRQRFTYIWDSFCTSNICTVWKIYKKTSRNLARTFQAGGLKCSLLDEFTHSLTHRQFHCQTPAQNRSPNRLQTPLLQLRQNFCCREHFRLCRKCHLSALLFYKVIFRVAPPSLY